MKKIFKLMLVIFTGVFFISKSWGYAFPGKSYAYVAGNIGNFPKMNPVLTRYQIDGNGNLVNPIIMKIGLPGADKVSGIAVSPDHRNIYVAYGSGIFRVRLHDSDRSLDFSDAHYYALNPHEDAFGKFDKSIAVSPHDHKLYVIINSRFARKVYSFDINADGGLKNLKEVLKQPVSSVSQTEKHVNDMYNRGISVDKDGTIFMNTQVTSRESGNTTTHAVVNVFMHGNMMELVQATIPLDSNQTIGGSKYISNIGGNGGLFVISNQSGGLATICSIEPEYEVEDSIKPKYKVEECLGVHEYTDFTFDHPAYDVDVNPDWTNTLYFTSGNEIFRWEINHGEREPVIMPSTVGIPANYIVTFSDLTKLLK